MILLQGGSSFFLINRMNQVNELNKDSYKVIMQMQNIQEAVRDADEDIFNFYSGNGWKSYTDGSYGTRAFYHFENGQLNADIRSIGQLFWHTQLIQGTFALNKQETYTLSFEAKSTISREMQILLENSVSHNSDLNTIVQLTNEMKTYSIRFDMKNTQDELAELVLALGKISENTTQQPHQVYIDNVFLVEDSTGRELIYNGQFVPIDIGQTLTVAENKFNEALAVSGKLISDSAEQKDSLGKLAELQKVWHQSKTKIMGALSLNLNTSGALSTDEVLSLEAKDITNKEINVTIDKIKQLEDTRLAERKREADTIKNLVYSSLCAVIFFFILLAVGIYFYFNRAIIKPIVWISDILKSIAEGEGDVTKKLDVKTRKGDLAVYEVHELYHHITNYSNLVNTQVQIDGLTGLANRKTFHSVMKEWIDLKKPFTLILIDIDFFKKVNDTYGHLEGDNVLKYLASLMNSVSRDEDLCFRFGGEEFGVLVQGEQEAGAFEIAERLRLKVAETPTPIGHSITISLGISAYQEEDSDPETVIERADAALYQSKSDGRNKTTIFVKK
jgi:diguanylate cyclase (GGDEF)-like protein